MGKESRRSLGGSNGDISAQLGDMPHIGKPKGDSEAPTKFMRILTVIAYIIGVSSGACLLSAYYIFFWVPQPTASIQRPTDSPFSLAQQGNTYLAGGSYYHHSKNAYPNPMDKANHPPSRASKRASKTTPSPHLPKPQYLSGKKVRKPTPTYPTTPTPPGRQY